MPRHKLPYEVKLIRCPVPQIEQVHKLALKAKKSAHVVLGEIVDKYFEENYVPRK